MMRRLLSCSILVLVASSFAVAAPPDPPGFPPLPQQVSAMRAAAAEAAADCGLRVLPELEPSRIAQAVAASRDPLEAARASGRPASRVISVKVPGSADPKAVLSALARACAGAPNAEPWSYAAAVSGASVGVVLWLPAVPSWMADPLRRERQVAEALLEVNLARTRGAVCGGVKMPPVPPLVADPKLRQVALDYAARQVRESFIGHVDPRGFGPGDRLAAAGLRPSAYGENLAYGLASPQSVVAGWLSSPGHCRNLMDPRFKRVGLDYFMGGAWGIVWAQELSS